MNYDFPEPDHAAADSFAPLKRYLTAADTLYVLANGQVKAITREGEAEVIDFDDWLGSRQSDRVE